MLTFCRPNPGPLCCSYTLFRFSNHKGKTKKRHVAAMCLRNRPTACAQFGAETNDPPRQRCARPTPQVPAVETATSQTKWTKPVTACRWRVSFSKRTPGLGQ